MYFPVLTDGTESTLTDRTLTDRTLTARTLRTREQEFDEDRGAADKKETADDDDGGDDEQAEADAEIAGMPETPPPSPGRPETESDTSHGQKSRSTRSVSFVETPQIMEDTIKKFDIEPNKPMSGVGPNWPPSTSQVINGINGSQLLERNDITQYPPAYRSALKQVETESESGQLKPNPPTPPRRLRKGRVKSTEATSIVTAENMQRRRTRPIKPQKGASTTMDAASQTASPPPAPPLPPPLTRQELAAKRSAPLQPLNASQKALAMLSQYEDYDDDLYKELNLPDSPRQPFVVPNSYRNSTMRKSAPSSLPALKKTKSKVFNWSATSKRPLALPPAPLSDCLTPAGRRVPHRLGLRYKTEAHKR